ncbi:MAG: arylsulfatase [Lentisphaeraceae bacterium]|nr:arylsulfatase [Lentisphaeraceae bacterium]
MTKLGRSMKPLCLFILLLLSLFIQAEKPSVILILVDDLGYSDLGSFGGEIQTPNIDKLAVNGLRMTQLYNSARCCPTRASLMTGLYPHKTGVGFMTVDNNKPGYRGFLNDNCVTSATILKQAGYKTYLAGKWHLRGKSGKECTPTNRGFDEFYGPFHDYADFYKPELYHRLPEGRAKLPKAKSDFYATDAITDHALHFMDDARKAKKPYYLYLAYNAPHFPLQAPKNLIDKYISTYEKGWDSLREERIKRMKNMGILPEKSTLSKKGIVPKVPNRNKSSKYYGKQIPAWNSLDSARKKDLVRRMATFAAMVDSVDQNVGRVIEDLKKNNEHENTVIFFLSDNGACAEWDPYGFDNNPYPKNKLHEGKDLDLIGQKGTFHSYGTGWANMCNTPFTSYKHYTYEGGISSPMIIHYPKGIHRPGRINRTVNHVMDIPATIIELAVGNYPKTHKGKSVYPLQGRSLVPIMNGQNNAENRTICIEHEGNRAIRSGKWKAVWTNYSKKWELFNIDADRSETHDIANSHPEIVSQLNIQWLNWTKENFVQTTKIDLKSKGMPTLYYK